MSITNLQEFESEFMNQARNMWGNFVDKIDFTFLISDSPPEIASLSYSSRPKAIGDILVQAPPKMTSRVKEKFFSLPYDYQLKVIIHEVGHIGYPNHDENFKRVVQQHGGGVTINQIEGGGYMVQKKSGSRFQTIKKFNSLEEAQEYAELLAKNPGNRIRISY